MPPAARPGSPSRRRRARLPGSAPPSRCAASSRDARPRATRGRPRPAGSPGGRRASSPELPETIDVDRVVLAAHLDDHRFHDEHDHQHIEEDTGLHDAGQAVRREDRHAEDPVLEDEEAEDVPQRVAAGDAQREADQRHRERQRDRALGRQLRRRGDRQHDDVGGDHEHACNQERDAGGPAWRDGAHGGPRADPGENARDDQPLDDHDDRGHQQEAASLRQHADRAREGRQQERLRDEEPQSRRPALSPDDQQRDQQPQERQEVRRRRHRTRNTAMTERKASATDPASSSGPRNNLSFATAVSSTATAVVRSASLPASARRPRSTATGPVGSRRPHGTKRFARSVMNRNSFIAAAHSTSARYRPEYSSTIASWIMVSSRCVAGLSTGSRPVSASMTMKNAANASRWAGLATSHGSPPKPSTMRPTSMSSARSASANTATMTVGSASPAPATSRLAPTAPNAQPTSSPASARKKVPSRNSDINRMIPANASGGREVSTGAANAATSIAPTST